MKLQVQASSSRRMMRGGFSLVEMMVALTVGVVVIGVVAAITIYTAKNFQATANYVDMDNQSRNALDIISREIRNATALTGQTPDQQLVLTNALLGTRSIITYTANPAGGTITLAKTGTATRTLLTQVDSFGFQLFTRYPTTSLSFYGSTNLNGTPNVKFCKVINMNWKCSRKILGSKLNTEIVQTAQVVLRNQVSK